MALTDKEQKRAAKLFAQYIRARDMALNGKVRHYQHSMFGGHMTQAASKALDQYDRNMDKADAIDAELCAFLTAELCALLTKES